MIRKVQGFTYMDVHHRSICKVRHIYKHAKCPTVVNWKSHVGYLYIQPPLKTVFHKYNYWHKVVIEMYYLIKKKKQLKN